MKPKRKPKGVKVWVRRWDGHSGQRYYGISLGEHEIYGVTVCNRVARALFPGLPPTDYLSREGKKCFILTAKEVKR